MTNIDDISYEYYHWLVEQVCYDSVYPDPVNYDELLMWLYNMEFTYILLMDENRAIDGMDLRGLFGTRMGYSSFDISQSLHGSCSVLEMIVALAKRCEYILELPDGIDRTGDWFWMMIDNLGLKNMDYNNFNRDEMIHKISIFLNRNYEHTGKGGLFYLPSAGYDMRKLEIWQQMNLFISEQLD